MPIAPEAIRVEKLVSFPIGGSPSIVHGKIDVFETRVPPFLERFLVVGLFGQFTHFGSDLVSHFDFAQPSLNVKLRKLGVF